jgi:hypothetical protein
LQTSHEAQPERCASAGTMCLGGQRDDGRGR